MPISKIIPTHRLGVYDVINPNGEDLGQVQDLMLDFMEGRIPFVFIKKRISFQTSNLILSVIDVLDRLTCLQD